MVLRNLETLLLPMPSNDGVSLVLALAIGIPAHAGPAVTDLGQLVEQAAGKTLHTAHDRHGSAVSGCTVLFDRLFIQGEPQAWTILKADQATSLVDGIDEQLAPERIVGHVDFDIFR